ncbi:MAG: sulfite exporter TauE/SafE family protein [Chitinophagaceae bacterium]|nr:sulfite exporter TauE/SafE family protein [Chitinophagaceae bacterium]
MKTKENIMSIQVVLLILFIGFAAGILSGLVGIGGGIVMVPALVFFLHYTQHQAQGTSLAVLTLPVVILASLYYYKQCRLQGHPVDLRVAGLLAAGFLAGAFFGSKLALNIEEQGLKKIFALVLLFTALKLSGWDKVLFQWIRKE